VEGDRESEVIHMFYLLALVAAVLLLLALRALVHLMLLHWEIVALCAGLGLPLLVLTVRAMGKGMMHHTAVTWNVLPPARENRQLPAPVRPAASGEQAPSSFSAELTEEPEQVPCEGPGCEELLGEMTWKVDAVTAEDGAEPVTETHSFCSRQCADDWTSAAEAYQAAALS
jgi:hypothetical protein